MRKKQVILYISRFNKFGGIETFIHVFCRQMAPHVNLTFMYDTAADELEVLRISDHCKVMKYTGQKIKTDVLILASAWGWNPEETVEAKKYIQMVHADYSVYIKSWEFKYKKGLKTTDHVCVGKNVAKQFAKVTAYKADHTIYNLLDPYKPAKKAKRKPGDPLKLITCSRVSMEKGFIRMIKMCELLRMNNISFVWDIYGDASTDYGRTITRQFSTYNNVRFRGVTDKVKDLISQADYCVQLSDTEGMPYVVQESLQAQTPVISTDYPAIHELVTHGENGYIFNMALSDFDRDLIMRIPKLKAYQPKSDFTSWLKIF